jgi:hypothetical protein
MVDKVEPQFLEVHETEKASRVDSTIYRLERFSDTRNAWILVKRRTKLGVTQDEKANFLEINSISEANLVDMETYRFECFSETRGTWMFVKRRVI